MTANEINSMVAIVENEKPAMLYFDINGTC